MKKKTFHANFGPYAWKLGKQAHKYTYTIMDIARCSGLSRSTIWTYKKLGKIDPNNLLSVVEFIATRASTGGKGVFFEHFSVKSNKKIKKTFKTN